MLPKELLDGIGVPFLDTQLFFYVTLRRQQFDDGVCASHVFDGQIRERFGPVALEEGL